MGILISERMANNYGKVLHYRIRPDALIWYLVTTSDETVLPSSSWAKTYLTYHRWMLDPNGESHGIPPEPTKRIFHSRVQGDSHWPLSRIHDDRGLECLHHQSSMHWQPPPRRLCIQEDLIGYSSIVSIKCDYPECDTSDEYLDSDRVEHQFLPDNWARVELQTDIEHEDHHDAVGLSALLCPDHAIEVRERMWPGKEPEMNHHR